MFSKTNIYEFKMMYRSGWILLLSAVLLGLIGFASFNGYQKVSKRTTEIEKAKEVVKQDDAKILDQIERIENGEDLGISNWSSPTNPSAIGYRHPRLVSMDAQELAYIETGQSDMYTHYMKPLIFGKLFALDYSEITNPVQLLFGTFDVSFVFIFIIPLLIIAFTYNVLSKEKELGTLRLIGSQPVAINKWLFHKMLLRYVVFSIISVSSFLLFALIFSNDFLCLQMFSVVLLLLVYQLFWFTISYLVNLKVNNSSNNAISLVGLWLVITLLIPALATQLSISIYPTPSRLNMVNEIREIEREMEEKQNEIMASFLQDHPELSENSDESKFGFWHRYFVAQDLLTNELEPLLDSHKKSLKNQQNVVELFKYISPSLLMSDAMSKVAGTSTIDYENYKGQVFEFASKWREHIQFLLFNNLNYTKETHENRPKFKFKPLLTNVWGHILTLIILCFFAVGISKLMKTKSYF